MPLIRKQQILIKKEASEGVSASPGASDVMTIFDPSYSDTVDQLERNPAGGSLSRGFSSVGRSSRQITFQSELRGSGDTTLTVDDPEWGPAAESSGLVKRTFKKVTLGAVTGTGFQIGEVVSQSSGAIRGIVLGAFTSGGVLTHLLNTSGGHLAVVPIVGTFTAAATTGESSGATATASAVADYEGHAYGPTSEKLTQVSVASWSGGTPAVGESLDVEVSGAKVGGVLVIADNAGGAFTSMNVTLMWGQMLNGNTLRTANGAGTGTISADPVQIRTPSVTARHNLDGRRRDSLGARANFDLAANVGEPAVFSWTLQGDLGPAIDAQPIATTGASTIRAPRMLGSMHAYGRGANIYRLPTKSFGLQLGNSINPNLDGNRTGGSTGTNVTDRTPELVFQTDMVHGAFDWEAVRDQATALRVVHLLGSTKGNIVGVVAPNAQVTQANVADANGVAAQDITANPRRVLESGDDEFFLVQL